MNYMEIYDMGRQVPDSAKKPITDGRLKGFTDINPMWRIKRLTEIFGPCGLGWWYVIKDKRLEQARPDEIRAFVDIDLYYKWKGEVSQPIPGTGGSSFCTVQKNGPYVTDECYKMALSDAISVSAKALGIGADTYYEKDCTKYTSTHEDPKQERKIDPKPAPAFTCEKCGKGLMPYTDGEGKPVSLRAHAERSKTKFGAILCLDCIKDIGE